MRHTAAGLDLGVDSEWVPTPDLEGAAGRILENYHGIFVTPGSPYRSMEGALEAIQFARTCGLPLVGT